MVLLSGAGVLLRSFVRLIQSDLGFQSDHLVAVDLQLPEGRYKTTQVTLTFARQALERVHALPGVTAAAASTGMPLEGYVVGTVSIPGRLEAPGRPLAWISAVTLDYFHTLGIPLKRGELFDKNETKASEGVIIDEAAARAYFPGEDPLGKQIAFYGRRTRTVLGIVGDTRETNLQEPPPPHIYQPGANRARPWGERAVASALRREHRCQCAD